MRAFKTRLLSAGLLVALFAWLVSWGGHTLSGQPILQPGQPGKKEKEKKEDRSELDENLPFAPPYERDAKKQLKAARDYLEFQNPPWERICPLLQSILDAKSDSFFDVKYTVGDTVRLNRISVKTEANRIIAAFPKEGLEFYQQLYGATASKQLDDAIEAKYDLSILADLSQRYFHTKAGAEGTILLGTIHLERGNYLEAAYAFERVLGRKDVEDLQLLTGPTLFKACIALKRSGDPKHTELYTATLPKLEKAARTGNGIRIGRKDYNLDGVRAELDRPVELVRPTALVGEWATKGGNPSRSGVVDGGPPFLDPIFRTPMFYTGDDEPNTWIKSQLDDLFRRDTKTAARGIPLPGTFPVTTSDLLMFRSYDGITAVATRDRIGNGRVVRAGEVVWRSKTTGGIHQLLDTDTTDDIDMKRDVQSWWGTYSGPNIGVTSILYENPLNGGLSHDGQYLYFVDDVAITPPPVFNNPEFGIVGLQQFRQSGDLADMVRAGRLAAVDMKSGTVKWDLGRVKLYEDAPPLPTRLTEEEADKTTDAFRLCLDAVFLSTPLPLNGKLYVLIEQGGVVRLLCLDPKNLVPVPGQTRKPTLLWSQKLGRPNTSLPQDSVRRYQNCLLAAGEGIIICPTNSGVVIAVDIMSRSLLWAYGYRHVEDQKMVINPQTGRPMPNVQLKPDRWRSSGPIISNGRVIFTAYDSRMLECLDLRTGKVLWSVPYDSNDLYVGGVHNDRVIVVGKNRVKAYHLTGEDKAKQEPKLAWESGAIPTPTGHGAMGKTAYYVPVRQDTAGKDTTPAAEIWAVNIETGAITSKTAARKRNDTQELAKYGLGNLVFQDGMVFSQSPWEVACYPQLEIKIAEMNKLLEGNENNALGRLARGELRLDEGKLKEAIEDFKVAEKNNLPPEKLPLLREKLYIAYTELLRADFNSSESFLEEYKTLCEVTATGDAPEDKLRAKEETDRRQRLYLYLLAKGRESQGRLGEAFDHYLALANKGEGKTLLEMPDEPNVRMRPDVWARGRIESMIRKATDPAAKKSLEDRINKEWLQVKDAGDIKRMREFVSIFGPYFASGSEAQFKLADMLIATNNDADLREAQMHLAQLRVTADDPVIRARATEALAQLMIKNRMLEDAVGLYLQLGKEYPDVVIRDGKTGSDFLTDLLTDKRLFPFLEPSRYPLPARVKVEDRQGNQNISYGAQFEIESPPDLFPMYRQWRFTLDQYSSQNRTWSLRGFDRGTGVEKVAFRNMVNPNMYSRTGQPIPYSKFVQGSGHLMLVQLGLTVYCFDLAERKELWHKSLLTDNTLIQPGQSYQVDVTPEGDCIIRFPNGTTYILGRSTILQPGHVCLLTSDGLECIEPQTRRVLWIRKGIAERTQIHGDARYIVLMEVDNNRKPTSTKLLRAVDGLVVENSPDSGRVLASAKSYRIYGRTALLSEGTGEEARVLRLYDLATGKDVWKKEFDAKSVPISSPLNSEWTGYVKPDGTAEVYSVRTGELIAKLKIDEKFAADHMKSCVEAQVLADAEKFYLILDRDPNTPSTNGTRRIPIYNNYMLRAQKVNGPIYAFDRGSHKRLWLYADVLENQLLVLEQFNDLPVIIAASPVMDSTNRQTYSVVVIEKDRGRLVYDKNILYNGNLFMSLTIDQKNGTINMNRYDYRVTVMPDEPKEEK